MYRTLLGSLSCFMFKKFLAFASLSFFWVSVVQAGYLPPPGNPFPSAENPYNPNAPVIKPLGYFTGIVLSGNIDVDIKTDSPYSQIVLTGDPEMVQQVQITEKNDTVTISQAPQWFIANKKGPAKVHADIYTRYLNDLTLKNYTGHLQAKNLNAPYLNLNLNHSGTVFLSGKLGVNQLSISGNGINQIQGIDSDYLAIQMTGNPSVDLTGVVNVQSINATGGRLRLYWVDSNTLNVRQSGTSSIELAGVVNHLMLHLRDSAYFNGRYLRTILGYAKTYDKSVADVQFLKSQAVLANDDSTISFFGKPPYKADFMGRNGAVLDMNDH